MDRTHFRVEVSHAEGTGSEEPRAAHPTLHLHFEGAVARLRGLLAERVRDGMDATEVDVSYRSSGRSEQRSAGVLTLSDRVTGTPILEVEVAPELIATLVQAARTSGEQSGSEAHYRVAIRADETLLTGFEQELLLVYDTEGTLQRHASLIPDGVEL